MKNFQRSDLSFSLCGLNCAVCVMKHDGYCPGCGGGNENHGCPIARCSVERGGFLYCFECGSYPCGKYDGITEFDSFISHRNQLSDVRRAQEIGMLSYNGELSKKASILDFLLKNYNDGRRKTFFSLAVNLLELSQLRAVMEQLDNCVSEEQQLKDKALTAVRLLESAAVQSNVTLKLRKRPKSG